MKFAVPPESGVSDDTSYSVPSNSVRTASLISSVLFSIEMIRNPDILVAKLLWSTIRSVEGKGEKKLKGDGCEVEGWW